MSKITKKKISQYQKQYRQANKEEINNQKKEYYKRPEIKVKIRKRNKEYYLENLEKIKLKVKEYQTNNKEKISQKNKQYYQENKQQASQYRNSLEVKSRMKKYNQRLESKAKKKLYRQTHKKEANEYMKARFKSDPNFRILCLLRGRTRFILKNYTKTGKIKSSIEYEIDYQAIINYLSPLPQNLSDYHIHHKRPLFTFNFINPDGSTNKEEIKKAFTPTNHELLLIPEHRKINHFELTEEIK